ncbi:MAG: hypothetical protein J6K03_01430 [Oscillospiraceae bacterium]|nr:hypothetical protein [Oscillospiraceae bacterium]
METKTMAGYDLYVFLLCLIVFIALTALFGCMLYYIIKQAMKTIRHGLEDERIKKEYVKEMSASVGGKIVCNTITIVLLVAIFAVFALSVGIQLSNDQVTGPIAVPKVVLSESMSYQHRENTYLQKNGLNDQFQMFDLIFTEELPGEFELQLYDIVVYEYRGDLIIHRIVGIEEPNEKHPDCRHFLLQGDAVKYADEFPVLYEQMKAIYRGQRIPYVGSFFAFMQSPAGYLCILLVIFAVVATPIAEKKLWEAKVSRLTEIGFLHQEEAVLSGAKGE